MGLIICNTHGESGFMPFVSVELANKINNNIPITKESVVFVDIILYDEDDGKELHPMKYWMSKGELESLSAKSRYEIFNDEDEKNLDKIFDPVMKGGGCCGKCFEKQIKIKKVNID